MSDDRSRAAVRRTRGDERFLLVTRGRQLVIVHQIRDPHLGIWTHHAELGRFATREAARDFMLARERSGSPASGDER